MIAAIGRPRSAARSASWPEHRLMTQVHAVEIADGRGTAP
jgi:hypothetical protein